MKIRNLEKSLAGGNSILYEDESKINYQDLLVESVLLCLRPLNIGSIGIMMKLEGQGVSWLYLDA